MVSLIETNVRFLHLVHFSSRDAAVFILIPMRPGFGIPTQLDVHALGSPTGNRLSPIGSDGLLVDLGNSERTKSEFMV